MINRHSKFTSCLLAIVLMSFTPNVSSAAPKTGAVCSKKGATQVSGNLKYTCISKGKKLVWNSGVLVKTTSNLPTSKPSAAPSSTPLPEKIFVTAQNAEVNKNCYTEGEEAFTLQGPVVCENQIWKIASRDYSIRALAFHKVLEHWNKQSDVNLKLNIYLDPAAGSWVNQIEAGIRAGARFWGTSSESSRALPIFVSDNHLFIENELAKVGITQSAEDRARNARAQGGQAGFHGSFDSPNMYMDFLFKKERDRQDVGFWQVGPHEYTHFAQSVQTKGKWLPENRLVWLPEGMATYIGSALGPMYAMPRNQMSNWEDNAKVERTPLTFFIGEDPSIYNQNGWSAVYSSGSLASEALLALIGIDAVSNIWNDIGKGLTNEQSYKKNIGLDGRTLSAFLEEYVQSIRDGKRWSLSQLQSKYEALKK
jgi:hypothetical protein